jgi:uncharacterized phage protein (TIGR01671 family)
MNRQIKFRAQRKDNREWVYGYLTHLTGMSKECIKQDGYYISDECGRQPIYLVEENTIGQFTGLFDKNGKEIYEGDIFEKTAHPRVYRQIVNSHGETTGEDYSVHPGVLVRYKAVWDWSGFYAQTIYVNPEGVTTGSTFRPQTFIEVGESYQLSSFFDQNRSEEIIGNIVDNEDLLTTK